MKKNLLYLFSLVCCLSLFVACGSDDDDTTPEDPWKDLTETYKDKTLIVTLEGKDFTTIGEVYVDATSAEAATLKLNNLLPEDKSITIDGKLTHTNNLYSLSGETKIQDCTVTLKGAFDKNGTLTLDITRTLSSEITGDLSLVVLTLPTTTGMLSYVPVHWKAVTGDEQTDAMLSQFGQTLGGLIASKVKSVDVSLATNGKFDVKWTKVGEEKPETNIIAEFIMQMVSYTVMDNKLYLVLEKSSITTISESSFITGLLPEGLDIKAIVALMEDMGGYYGLPLDYQKQEDGSILFKMSKDQLLPIVNVITPLFASSIPEEMKPMFDALLQALPNTKELEIGLPFVLN